MLITGAEILSLLKEEGLKFYLISSVAEAADLALGLPGRRTETRRLLYGSFKPPAKMENVDIPQGSSRQGELLVYFAAANLSREDIAGKPIDYDGQRWAVQYIAEVSHRGVQLMHLIKLVASRNSSKQDIA